uniref:F-box domain-containing protein n=1 Tax=Mycena chlorophos TaxID=658473 RepID=A0ABQ0MCS7_MYCCL|nr:predicted protein [Mycena chlorophos]
MSEKLATEIWLAVLSSISDDEDLLSVSLTNRNLHRITQPLRHTHFEFHPYATALSKQVLLPEGPYVGHAIRRLELFRSEPYASYVRGCVVSPWQRVGKRAGWTFGPDPQPMRLLHTLLDDVMPRFRGLKRLTLKRALITTSQITKLAKLATLEHLELEDCTTLNYESISDIETPESRLSLQSLKIKTGVLAGEETFLPWMAIIDPTALLSVVLRCDIRAWTNDPASVPQFPRVKNLQISLNQDLLQQNVQILSRFPALEKLNAGGWGDPSNQTLSMSLVSWPKLRALSTTHTMLPFLVEMTPNLEDLCVSCAQRLELHPTFLTLQKPELLQRITSLSLELDADANRDLELILVLFPSLVRLEIELSLAIEQGMLEELENRNPVPTDLLMKLRKFSTLPRTLEFLALKWIFDYEVDPDDLELDLTDFASGPALLENVLAGIQERCPKLRAVWLDGGDKLFFYSWQRKDGDKGEVAVEEEFVFGENALELGRRYEAFKTLAW